MSRKHVAHTKKRWWKWLPSMPVIIATLGTQAVATAIAISGIFFQGIDIWQVVLVWGWAIAWMQLEELAKWLFQKRFTVL